MSDDGKATEEWHAAGLRVGKGGKRAYAWVDAGHHVLTFPQRSGTYSLGAVYEVEVSRDGDNDPLDAALAPLLDVASRLRTRVQRRAFTAEVLRRLEAGW